jgi:cytochrome c biogenesis protein
VLRTLANLKLAIAELATVAALSAVGTVIPQNKPYQFYLENYPDEGEKVLGFVTSKLIWALQWDHIYTADYFLLLIALWAASLAACTATTQWPAVKVAQRWRFKDDPDAVAKLENAEILPNARLQDLGSALANKQYQVGGQGLELLNWLLLIRVLAPLLGLAVNGNDGRRAPCTASLP